MSSGTLVLLVHAEDNIWLGENINNIKKKSRIFLIADRESGLEADAEKTMQKFISREHNAE
jgi:hypothetical protein